MEEKIQWISRSPILFLLENSYFLCVQYYEEARRKNDVCLLACSSPVTGTSCCYVQALVAKSQ